jgi:PhoPQ-activated pathogenicity-related protein
MIRLLRPLSVLAAVLPVLAACSAGHAGARPGRRRTALDRYVAKPDPSFSYRLASSRNVDGATVYVLDMVSQTWRSPAEVDRTRWEHWLTIIQPAEVRSATGFLYLTGGSNGGPPPASPDPFLARLAAQTHTVVAELRMVPNEPLTFAGETQGRTEDAIIAYTWERFLKTGDETWPLRLPMTKSAVRAMDAVTAFCGAPERGSVKVEKFFVSGGSKRGWTTWTTAAVDDRVVGIAPLVIDVLNVPASMEHHFRSYGFWAPAVEDYTAMKLQQQSGTDRYRTLMEIEDPYSYRDRLTMPKLIVNSTGDQYFLPDSWQFYWKGLRGEKYLDYVPNTKHNLSGDHTARETLQAFYEAIVARRPRPRFSWKVQRDGSIRVETPDHPTEVKLWQATNPRARDFRLDTLGPAYASAPLRPEKEGVYVARVPEPAEGWTAFFVQLTFASGGTAPYRLTTGVHVVPDTLPFPAPGTGVRP